MFLRHSALAVSSLIVLCGCTALSTPYVRPALPPAPGWQASATQPRMVQPDWWTAFGSPDINALVATTLTANTDIAAAALRARRAALQAEQAGAGLWPKLSGSLNSSVSSSAESAATQSHAIALGASYEIDLWGRLSAQQAAGKLEALASQDDVEAARMTVVASVIETNWRLGAVNQQIAQARKSLATVQQMQDLVASQVALGAASQLDTNEVAQTVAAQQASLSDLLQAREVLRGTLAVLLDGRPSPVAEPTALPTRTPVMVAAGLPADMLANRPDLRAAELRLRGTLKGVDSARSSLYPQLTLTGNLGSSSVELSNLLSNPVATLGTGLLLPFLNFREGQLAVRVSELQYEEAVLNFRRTLLSAFSDVGVALSARTRLIEKMTFVRQSLSAAQEAEALTEQRYRTGAITLRLWLDAQERRRGAEAAVTAVRLDQLLNEVLLFRVLGTSPMSAAS